MAKITYCNTPENLAIAEATVERHHIWINVDKIHVFTGEDLPQEMQQDRMIPLHEFRNRFYDAELVGVAASNDPKVRTAILKITTRDDGMVPINDETRGVLDHMVSIGLLTADRPAQLLA